MTTQYYFAYGSNMSALRLQHEERVPSATPCDGYYVLDGHAFWFNKRSVDKSGKGNIVQVDNGQVLGRLFSLDANEIKQLDKVEGPAYNRITVEVVSADGKETVSAVTYRADKFTVCENLKPYDWYKHHVLVGARESGLPMEYIAAIDAVEANIDSDKERVQKELKIYQHNR